MNRTLLFGIAILIAIVGIALSGQSQAVGADTCAPAACAPADCCAPATCKPRCSLLTKLKN